ncbi:MAG: porin family protein [Bacteroidia bacterium]
MKTTLKPLFIMLFLLFNSEGNGQSLNLTVGYTSSTARIEGLTLGESTINHSDGSTEYASIKINRLNGFNFGAGYEFRLGNHLSLETGLRFQTRGYSLDLTEEARIDTLNIYAADVVFDMSMNYLDVPLVLNTSFTAGDFRFYARTGMYLGVLGWVNLNTQVNMTSIFGNDAFSEQETYGGRELENKLTAGIILGAGVEYKGFFLEANYNRDLRAYGRFEDDLFYDNKTYTRDLSLNVGYRIKFGK